LLLDVHARAERRGQDLAAALRELAALGLASADQPGGQAGAADPKIVKRWTKAVEQAVQAGRTPFEPLLDQEASDADLDALAAILAKLDYRVVYKKLKVNLHQNEPLVERVWQRLKGRAPSAVEGLVGSLEKLEEQFLARKKLRDWGAPGDDETTSRVWWLMADPVVQRLGEPPSDNKDDVEDDVDAVRKLIAARYLVADDPTRPWEFLWDD
jgi:hypothetical protein